MRFTTRITTGLIGGALIAIAAPLAASAHVSVSPDTLTADGHGVLTFSFSHGCETSPTTSLRITMPEGLTSVAPTMDSDWSIDVERGSDGLVSAVTYTALTPVPVDLRGAVSMSVGLDEDTPDTLVFPVVQTCVDGANEWTQIAADGEDPHSLDNPAPVVTVTAGEADGHATTEHENADATASDAEPASDPLGTIMGGAGLVAGIAALVVAVLAYRRRA